MFELVQIIEPLYEVLRVLDGDRRPSIGLVYAKLEAAKKKIHKVSPRYAHLVLDVVQDRWDRQMSRDLHKAAYYLHPTYHYTHELEYEDDLTAAFTRVVERLSRSPLQAVDAIYEASIEEADDPEDPSRPNTFLARTIAKATTEDEGDRADMGQPYSPQFQADPEVEVDLLGDIELERVERTINGSSSNGEGGGGGDTPQGGGGDDSGHGGGGDDSGHATQYTNHGAPLQYNRRQKFSRGGHAEGLAVDSNSFDTMILDFERMSTQEFVGSYGGHSYHPESIGTNKTAGTTNLVANMVRRTVRIDRAAFSVVPYSTVSYR
ncbi:hypothetical protein Taro_014929 [Colocasia esculenta]|uniref:Uncharacterized protein n=1 Tax=Colocasia esculenta TaxID=4460 RepID=A0A843UFY8_COLES|nr:hypothetical protein [Colocasia esculenta]